MVARDFVEPIRRLLDRADPLELLNHPTVRRGMRAVVNEAGRATRPEIATQAFLIGAGLERQRVISALQNGTWPVHDEPGPAPGA